LSSTLAAEPPRTPATTVTLSWCTSRTRYVRAKDTLHTHTYSCKLTYTHSYTGLRCQQVQRRCRDHQQGRRGRRPVSVCVCVRVCVEVHVLFLVTGSLTPHPPTHPHTHTARALRRATSCSCTRAPPPWWPSTAFRRSTTRASLSCTHGSETRTKRMSALMLMFPFPPHFCFFRIYK
jgi:hypothetical protein